MHKRSKRETDNDFAQFAGHRTGVNSLAFSDDGLILASGGKVLFFNKIIFFKVLVHFIRIVLLSFGIL